MTSRIDLIVQRHNELDELREEYKAVIGKIAEIQRLLDIMAQRTSDDYLRVELLTLYSDLGGIADRLTKAFRKSFQVVIKP